MMFIFTLHHTVYYVWREILPLSTFILPNKTCKKGNNYIALGIADQNRRNLSRNLIASIRHQGENRDK